MGTSVRADYLVIIYPAFRTFFEDFELRCVVLSRGSAKARNRTGALRWFMNVRQLRGR